MADEYSKAPHVRKMPKPKAFNWENSPKKALIQMGGINDCYKCFNLYE